MEYDDDEIDYDLSAVLDFYLPAKDDDDSIIKLTTRAMYDALCDTISMKDVRLDDLSFFLRKEGFKPKVSDIDGSILWHVVPRHR